MKLRAKKEMTQELLMQGLQQAISSMPSETPLDIEVRNVAVEQFRRIEKLFGYEPKTWSPFC